MALRQSIWIRYGVAVVLSFAAVLSSIWLRLLLGEPFYFPLLVAVMFGALWGGFGPGLLATGIAIIGFNVFVLQPIGGLALNGESGWATLFFAATAAVVASLGSSSRRAREASESAVAQLNAVLRHMQHAVIAVGSTDARILFFNARAQEILGGPPVPPQEAADRPDHLLRSDGSALPIQEYPVVRALADEVTAEVRIPFQRADGGRRVLEWTAAPIRDDDGPITGAVTVFSDVTDKVAQEERARFLVEATALLHSSFDYRDTVSRLARRISPAIADWCVVDLFDEQGATVRLAIVHTDPEREKVAWEVTRLHRGDIYISDAGRDLLRQGEPLMMPVVNEALIRSFSVSEDHFAGLKTYEACSAALLPLPIRGKIVGTMMLMMAESGRHFGPAELDFLRELGRRVALAIDNARLYQQAQEAVQARDEFLSIASHDLRTPLTTVKLQVQRLARKAHKLETAPVHSMVHDLDNVDRLVSRTISMFNVLMDVSRIQAGRLELERSETDLSAVTNDVLQRMEPVFAASGCAASFRSQGPAFGHWDKLRLDQVVTNLLNNAAKYGAGKPVEVSVESEGGAAILSVRDHGIGIAPEHLQRLFHRFERVGDKKAFAGSGLGLWITRQIVEAHGGTIQAESSAEGSTFTVVLPVHQKTEAA